MSKLNFAGYAPGAIIEAAVAPRLRLQSPCGVGGVLGAVGRMLTLPGKPLLPRAAASEEAASAPKATSASLARPVSAGVSGAR